jgi:hypothetical protein
LHGRPASQPGCAGLGLRPLPQASGALGVTAHIGQPGERRQAQVMARIVSRHPRRFWAAPQWIRDGFQHASSNDLSTIKSRESASEKHVGQIEGLVLINGNDFGQGLDRRAIDEGGQPLYQ